MGRIRLIKLLYLADRKILKDTGRPLFGGRACAMQHGPVHSEILDLINGKRIDETRWSEFIETQGPRFIALIKDPGVAKLAPCEVDALNDVSDSHATMEDWDVAMCTHALQEWKKHYPDLNENTSRPIPLEDILDALGMQNDKDGILADARAEADFDRLFAS